MKLKVLDLFSGIGGFSLGLERTGGFETVAFCEIEPYAQKILKKHWPDVPIFEDVRKLKGDEVGSIDVICGGYPCQPFSTAGQRRGTEDDRHLWPEVYRLVDTIRPAWCVFENVAGHISMGLDEVLFDLENAGYTGWPLVVPAVAVDAPHRRDRVWIMANNDSQHGRASRTDQTQGSPTTPVIATSKQPKPLAHPISQRGCSRHTQRQDAKDVGQPSGREGNHTGGMDHWKPEPSVGRVAHGVPRRMDRLRCLGNAVVPQIPEMIGNAILAAEAA